MKDTEQVPFVYEAPHEEVREATLKPDGTPYPTQPSLHNYYGRTIPIHPKLENRDVVVERTHARRGHYERSLSDVVLPPAKHAPMLQFEAVRPAGIDQPRIVCENASTEIFCRRRISFTT